MDWRILVAVMAVVVAAGCTGSPGADQTGQTGETGMFGLLVSDQPSAIDDFQALNVTFSEARLFRVNASEDGYTGIELPGPKVDLTKVKGDKAKDILMQEIEAGRYSKIELHVSRTAGFVEGQEVDVMVPSQKLMITKQFMVAPNETTEFVFDINVVRRGNQGYNLLPVISESGIVGREVEVERQGDRDRGNPGQEAPPTSPSAEGPLN